MAGARKNVRTKEYRALLDRLPERIRNLADLAFRQFCDDPAHPALHRHALTANSRGQHPPGSIAVRVAAQYRAIYFEDGDTNVWCWIGTHNDYETYTGRK